MSFDDNNNNGCIKLNNGKMILRAHRAALLASVCLGVIAVSSQAFAEVKALSFAINEVIDSQDKTPIQNYMSQNGIDFGVFDYTKGNTYRYFVTEDFTQNGKNFKVVCFGGANNWAYTIYDSDRYELVNVPADDKSGYNITAVFKDEYGDQFALISLRATNYNASKPATLTPVKTYIEGIAAKYPNAKLIVTYNARLSSSLADVLDTYLTETSSGPQMTCLGRTSADETNVGGVYLYPSDVPASYSVSLVSNSIGTRFNGTLATLGFPTKCTVVFNDWDGTGLQTNIVFAGESVTPPTVPGRDGYTFTGWDHAASEFASVLESFTATAQYASNAAWLHVSGDPENLGTADPAYGAITEISANDTFTATVSNPAVEEGVTERWVCTGYTHYEITDLATGAKTVAQEGNGSSFSYTHVMHDELVWHFTNEWLVSVSATAGGSVSVAAENWVRNGETISLVATPEEGYSLWRWEGDTDGIADVTSASIDVAVTSARSLRAIFAPQGADASVQYVATTGDDANNGYSRESPKLTIQAAVNALAQAAGYGTVYVAPGLYERSSTESTAVADHVKAVVAINSAIAVVGDTDNPEDVVVRNTSMFNSAQVIVFYLNHPGALVANLTAECGHRYGPKTPFGCNVSIDALGGAVSNCIMRGAVSDGNYARGAGAWLNSENALLTHCVVTNNSASGSGYQSTESGGKAVYGGIFVHIEKGTVDNCLIANNRDIGGSTLGGQDKQSWSSSVTVRNGGSLLNSSVVTNEARWTGGVYLYPNGTATNVVVAGCVNMCTYINSLGQIGWSDIGFKGTLANASHCASDGGEALDGTCVAGTAAEFFADFNGGDYRLSKNSPLRNKGLEYDDIAEFDLVGKKRVQGSKPDIGCFESAPSGLSVIIR